MLILTLTVKNQIRYPTWKQNKANGYRNTDNNKFNKKFINKLYSNTTYEKSSQYNYDELRELKDMMIHSAFLIRKNG